MEQTEINQEEETEETNTSTEDKEETEENAVGNKEDTPVFDSENYLEFSTNTDTVTEDKTEKETPTTETDTDFPVSEPEQEEQNNTSSEESETPTTGEEPETGSLQDIHTTLLHIDNVLQYETSLLILILVIVLLNYVYKFFKTSVYKGYKQDKIEMRGDRAEMSDFPLYLNMVAGGLDRRDQTIGGFSFVVKIYAVPVVEIIG